MEPVNSAPNQRNVSWTLLLFAVTVAAAFAVSVMVGQNTVAMERRYDGPTEIAIAFAGNSMQYFNDCPRLVEQMIEAQLSDKDATVYQDSCLRGGATLSSLWKNGNGMAQKFSSEAALIPIDGRDSENSVDKYDVGANTVDELLSSRERWDFFVLNDHSQSPARNDTRMLTEQALREYYAPSILQHHVKTTILIQTPAYRTPGLKDSDDLGNFHEMTDLVATGLLSYKQTLDNVGIDDCRIAPVGEAYRYVHDNNKDLWEKLYSHDDFHPSPYGTWLQACVIFCTCFRDSQEPVPPIYNSEWWELSRIMQPRNEEPLPRPSEEEAMELRAVACAICGVKLPEGERAMLGKPASP